MKRPTTPIGTALFNLAICLVVAMFVIAVDRAVLQSPIRLWTLVVVALGVPVANYVLIRHQQARSTN